LLILDQIGRNIQLIQIRNPQSAIRKRLAAFQSFFQVKVEGVAFIKTGFQPGEAFEKVYVFFLAGKRADLSGQINKFPV